MKKRRKESRGLPLSAYNVLQLKGFELTTEAIKTEYSRALPKDAKDAIRRLYGAIQTNASAVVNELRQWIERYPDIPIFYNYLSVAYSNMGKRREAEEIIETGFRRAPDYLFARLNYAEICIMRGDYRKVAELLGHKFDIQAFYPQRKRFHISEFVAFTYVVGMYFIGIEDYKTATVMYEALSQVAPEHYGTRQLRSELQPSLLRRLARRFFLRKPSLLTARTRDPNVIEE